MSNNRIIMYAVLPSGQVVSRVGNEMAWPVLDFEAIGMGGKDKHPNTGEESQVTYPKGNFYGPTRYDLQTFTVGEVAPSDWQQLRWTKKIPREVKNYHRAFWGMKPLKGPLTTWEK